MNNITWRSRGHVFFESFLLILAGLGLFPVFLGLDAFAQERRFCEGAQANSDQCRGVMAAQQGVCEQQGGIWNAEESSCTNARILGEAELGRNAAGVDQYQVRGEAIQQARDNANLANDTAADIANGNLRYHIAVSSPQRKQPILVGLAQTLNRFTENVFPALAYESIRSSSWVTPYEIDVDAQERVRVFSEEYVGCNVKAWYQLLGGKLSVGFDPESLRVGLNPNPDRAGVFTSRVEVRLKVGGILRLKLIGDTCVNHPEMTVEVALSGLNLNFSSDIAAARNKVTLVNARLEEFSVEGPSINHELWTRVVQDSAFIDAISTFVGVDEIVHDSALEAIRSPAISDQLNGMIVSTLTQSLGSISGLGEPIEATPGVTVTPNLVSIGTHSSVSGFTGAFRPDVTQTGIVHPCAAMLRNSTRDLVITRRPRPSNAEYFISAPYSLLGEVLFVGLRSGIACPVIPASSRSGYTIGVQPNFSGEMKVEAVTFGTRNGDLARDRAMEWDHPIERENDPQVSAPLRVTLPFQFIISAAGLSGTASASVSVAPRIWWDPVKKQMFFTLDPNSMEVSQVLVSPPALARLSGTLGLQELVERSARTSVQIGVLGLTPAFTTLDSRFEATPTRIEFSPADLVVKLSLNCVRDCQSAPVQSGRCVTGMRLSPNSSDECLATLSPTCGAVGDLVVSKGRDVCRSAAGVGPTCAPAFGSNRVQTDYREKEGADVCEYRAPAVPVFSPGTPREAELDTAFRLARRLMDPGPTSKGFLKCHDADSDFYREHDIQYGEREADSCRSCLVGRSQAVWDLTLRQCVLGECAVEERDGDRIACGACRSRGSSMKWESTLNQCVKYYEVDERYALCRAETGYDVQNPRGDARSCIECVSTPGTWDARRNRCTVTREVQRAERVINQQERQAKPTPRQQREP